MQLLMSFQIATTAGEQTAVSDEISKSVTVAADASQEGLVGSSKLASQGSNLAAMSKEMGSFEK